MFRIFAFLLVNLVGVFSLNNSVGLTPAMGWLSWPVYGCTVNESLIRQTALALTNLGLYQAGYEYINLGDCWAATTRDANDNIQADPDRFPSGIPALSQYVHSMGYQFGIYSGSGKFTCQNRVGSYGYETEDATTFANWDVDYLTYDNCNNTADPKTSYPIMTAALNATGRPIYFAMSDNGAGDPAEWGFNVSNSWRTTTGMSDSFETVLSIVDQNDQWAEYAVPGGWNDADVLETGNGGMSFSEYRSQFALWCIIKSPLMIGVDVTTLSPEYLSILTNSEAIAVNQDPLGAQGSKQYSQMGLEIWGAPLANGNAAILLLNRSTSRAGIAVSWALLGFNCNIMAVRDLYLHQDMGNFTTGYSVSLDSHDSAFLILTVIS